MANAAAFVGTAKIGLVQIVNADSTGQKSVYTAGSLGTKIAALVAASTDTAARTLTVSILRGGTNYQLGATQVAVTAGNDGTTASADLLANITGLPVDNDGQKYLFLQSGDVLQIAAQVAITAAKTMNVSAIGGDF